MKIFISWSKNKSMEIAVALEAWLKLLFNNQVDTWLSTKSIDGGTISFEEIEKGLISSDHGIFCITKDNVMEPWIMFEAGAIFRRTDVGKRRSNLWPVLFEGEIASLDDTPLKHFQITRFNKVGMYTLAKSINNKMETPVYQSEEMLEKYFDAFWQEFSDGVKVSLGDCSISGGACVDKDLLIHELQSNGNFPLPHIGDVTFYESGFEDHPLYEILLSKAEKRLWVFGRKNKKLFDQRNTIFWHNLPGKIKEGFDFKCLFLNPYAPDEVVNAAQVKTDFVFVLKACILEAYNKLDERRLPVGDICKLYSIVRHDEIIIIDNAVLYSHIGFNSSGLPQHLTNSSFNLVEINNEIGIRHKKNFEDAWKNAIAMDNDFITSIKA